MASPQFTLQGWGIDELTYPLLERFATAEQHRLTREDLFAARNVSLKFVVVIGFGLLKGLFPFYAFFGSNKFEFFKG